MKVSIFGLGYVGAVSLACLARDGHDVVGVDVDQAKLKLIREGHTPVVEEGMVDLMKSVSASGRVEVTDDVDRAIANSDLSFICVGTPSAPNGSQDQTAILRIAKSIGRALTKKTSSHVLVFRSTVVPGTTEGEVMQEIEKATGKPAGDGYHLCFQPEFLREGSSIRDYDNPPFTVLGSHDAHATNAVKSLFGHLPGEFIETSIRAAETLKYCCNNFHALKITFANEVARLCAGYAVDPFEVMDLLTRDRQLNVSPAYLKPGFAFGGSCLPKDLRATLHLAKINDVDLPLIAGIVDSNRVHLDLAVQKVIASGARRVALMGLSFKAGTDDLRESPLVALAEALIGKGIELSIYDPGVRLSWLLGANQRYINEHLPHIGKLLSDDVEAAISTAQLVIAGSADPAVVEALRSFVKAGQPVLDLVNLPNPSAIGGEISGLSW
ncbi:MAG: nucleotide sugar dehydrogenase [Burkholderiaceae bacterium]